MLGMESRRSVACARRKISEEAWTRSQQMADSPTEDDPGAALSSPFWSFDVLLKPNHCWQNLWEVLGKYLKKGASAKRLLSLSSCFCQLSGKTPPGPDTVRKDQKGREKKINKVPQLEYKNILDGEKSLDSIMFFSSSISPVLILGHA